MSLIRPFAGLRPAPGRAADVLAPPYDVLNTEEARVRAAGRPWSFLHISKPEIDLPAGTDPYGDAVYVKGRRISEDARRRCAPARSRSLLLRIPSRDGRTSTDRHRSAASVPDYDSNRIRKHEFTRPTRKTIACGRSKRSTPKPVRCF
jgi:uncharacterized protein (DUF1015 family)